MSVIPLTFAIHDGLAPDLDREPQATDERPGTFDNDKFDKHFDAAFEQASSKFTDAEVGGQISEPKGLDARLKENMERVGAKEAEAAEFKASREARDELNERYGKQGDIAKHLDMIVQWTTELKRNPAQTAQQMAEAYARATPWALNEKKETPPEDDPYGRKKLDNILADAIDHASSENQDFKATAKHRAALKEVFPHLSFDEALKTIVRIDRDMHKDPLNTAGAVAAMFGMPVTPQGMAAEQQTQALGSAIDSLIPNLPNFNGDAVAHVLQLPDFKRSADPIADVQRAHEISQRMYQYSEDLGQYAFATVEALPPALREETKRVMASPEFAKMTRGTQPYSVEGYRNLDRAIGVAQQRLNSRVTRAKRAAPVRGSSSMGSTGGKQGGLDAAISNALANY